MKQFNFNHFFEQLNQHLNNDKSLINKLKKTSQIFKHCNSRKNKVIFIGNGGSAATSSHVSVDLTKNAKILAINFNEPDLITCLSNDYGYENYLAHALRLYAAKGDVVVFISCSGESPNLKNAMKYCKKKKLSTITFTGRSKKNSLVQMNKTGINFWVDSNAYNIIETVHHALLLSIVDDIIGKSVYEPN
jgi:D-sedoheptulose 7-phosphate isomerase